MAKINRKYSSIIIGFVILVALLLLLTQLNKLQPNTSTSNNTETFTVIAKQFEFDFTDSGGKTTVDQLNVSYGDTVVLHIKSVDVGHGFALPDFKINQNLAPGQEYNITFLANKRGTFVFFCSVFCGGGHANMRGSLTVS